MLRVGFLRLAFILGCALCLSAQEQYRPQFHFSPERNWTNDPNGLVYFDGEYHLFFQYNPFGDKWGHMSWGHAVSRDLLHWTQLPVALPEENGVMIFTGSTVVDKANTSGFCTGGKPCLVAVYTGHTPASNGKKALQTQNIAYSNDRGRTWTKFSRNPVLDLHMSDFRDPKVFWSDEGKQWVMAVALPDDHKVQIYGSPNLKDWKQMSDFGPAGATSGQWECPELFPLPIENEAGSRWVLKIGLNPGALQGGSGEQYFIGRFDGTRFINDNGPSQTLWTDYGKDCYCSLTFNNLPKTQPAVMMGWMDNWQYAADLPTEPWRGQMTIPRKLTLRKTAGGLRLVQEPLDGLSSLRQQEQRAAGTAVSAVNKLLSGQQLSSRHTADINVSMDLGSAQAVGLKLLDAGGSETRIHFDRSSNEISVDRTKSGETGFSREFVGRVKAPLRLEGATLRLRVLVDADSIEVFADGGQVAITSLVFPHSGAETLQVFAEGGDPGKISVQSWMLNARR